MAVKRPQKEQGVTGDNTAPSCGPDVNHCLPGWEAWLGIISSKEPLQVGEGWGEFHDEMIFNSTCCLLSAYNVQV